ncbi:hypothetical protein B0H16DRAFT_1470191 [Mycena metata]|uniref:Uncharacterized protein n=1 Tax=Mycena metata TaxID=1033252 RepID=A0AAD7HV15_9AGAR|nr:hypothetical protein B0H16DRAFT_1470191 [Mycena metata]
MAHTFGVNRDRNWLSRNEFLKDPCPLGTVSGFDHHAMQGRVTTTTTVFFLGRLYARSLAIHSTVDAPRPLVRGEAASIVFARAINHHQSVCAPSSSRSSLSSDFIWVVPQFAQSMVITTLASPPPSWQAGFRNISFNTSTSDIHVSANNCSHVDSFGITTTALVILECPYRWPMSIPADIHWLRVSVKADDRYGRDNRIPEPIPVLRGANLFGMVTWTKRKVRTQALWPAPTRAVRASSLTRLNEYGTATKLLQDTAAATVLSGLASFGGLWTFINTVFAFLLGANIVYFVFVPQATDRYPRSASCTPTPRVPSQCPGAPTTTSAATPRTRSANSGPLRRFKHMPVRNHPAPHPACRPSHPPRDPPSNFNPQDLARTALAVSRPAPPARCIKPAPAALLSRPARPDEHRARASRYARIYHLATLPSRSLVG